MNPTVITTGPGVIIATATASTNCRSVSQRCSFTTPPYRNGTIARPLPKTNAPALAKNKKTCHSVVLFAAGTAGRIDPNRRHAGLATLVLNLKNRGGAVTS